MSKRIVLLQALTTMPNDLVLILGSMADETAVRPGPDGCSLNDVLHYLLAVEAQMRANLQQMLTEQRPLLTPLPAAPTPQATDRPFVTLLAQFKQARADTLTFLQSVSAGGWQRPAQDPVLGDTKFRFLVQQLVAHDTEYLNHLIGLQQQLKSRADRDPQPVLTPSKSPDESGA